MKQQYREINFRQETLDLIAYMNALIDSYMKQGFVLSVRQLYYQLVSRDKVANTEQSYKQVADVINRARLAGLMDWDAIEDRNRDVEMRTRWGSGLDILQACVNSFHMDMWDTQYHRVYVVIEKAALAGVLRGVCTQYDVPLLAARGYPSVSILRELTLDHFLTAIEHGQHPVILHLGDHDPSGIDMTRDLQERITMFATNGGDYSEEFTLHRIALSMEQIEEKRPPPNPAKTTDARFSSYRRKYGTESWELDALEPSYLTDLVENYITRHIEHDDWEARREEIEHVRGQLDEVARNFPKAA